MKKLIYLTWMLFISINSYSQVNVESVFVNNSNRLNSQFMFLPGEDVSQDLFFSIGPNGVPQYGQSVNWNVSPGTIGKVRSFHVKKGDWDRSAIRTAEEDITFTNSINHYPVQSTPNIDLGTDWIKLGSSWNFSHDNYAIAIISFTNQSSLPIDGKILFSHADYGFISVPEVFNYNDWAELDGQYPDSGRQMYEFKYKNLASKEVRHLYIKIDLSKESFKVPDLGLSVEMVGYGSDDLPTDDTFPPHDPNALTLVTALENTTLLGNCDAYSEFPELQDLCEKGKPYWVQCPRVGDPKCPLAHSIHYPYCNEDSEMLTYRINCLNDGAGASRHVQMINTFSFEMNPFVEGVFSFTSSDDFMGSFNYPDVRFLSEDIYLPGLSDESFVYTYDECSAKVTFTVQTICNINEEIDAQALITFFDIEGNSVGDVATNNVMIVPQQGVYTNYEPHCLSCGFGGHGSDSRILDVNYQLQSSNSEISLAFDRNSEDEQVSIQIFNVSGQLMKTLNILTNKSLSVREHIDISNLHSGIYFITIQSGEKNHVDKFIKP